MKENVKDIELFYYSKVEVMCMQNWLEVAKAIGDLGLLIVITAFAIVYVVNLIKNKQDRDLKKVTREDEFKEKWDQIVTDFILSKITANHLIEEENNSTMNEKLIFIMNKVLQEVKADRVLFFSYHNGGQDYEGRSFQRMSCINEVVSNHKPIQTKYNNMFRTALFYIYTELNKNNYFNILDIENVKTEDPGFYYMAIEDNIKSAFGCGIRNKKGQTIGFIMYCFSQPKTDIKELIPIIKKSCYTIEGVYLMNKDDSDVQNKN